MGQIVFNNQKPKYCKLQAIRPGGLHVNDDVALNEVWLVDTTEAPKSSAGTGEYDAYIIGDGSLKAGQLLLHYLPKMGDIPTNLSQLNEDTNHQTVSQIEKDIWNAGGAGQITNNVDNEDLASVEIAENVSVIKFKDKDYNASDYSGYGKKYLRKNYVTQNERHIIDITPAIGTEETAPSEDPDETPEKILKKYMNLSAGVGGTAVQTNRVNVAYFKKEVVNGDSFVFQAATKGEIYKYFWGVIDKQTSEIYQVGGELPSDEGITSHLGYASIELPSNVDSAYLVINVVVYNDATYFIKKAKVSDTSKVVNIPIAINTANTIFIISYDFDLNGSILELPENSVLKFEGGSIKNGFIVGNRTTIEAGPDDNIFGRDTELTGSWKNHVWRAKWFGAYADGVRDDTKILQKMLNLSETTTTRDIVLDWYDCTFRTTKGLIIKDSTVITGGTIKAKFDNPLDWVLQTYCMYGGRKIVRYNGCMAFDQGRVTRSSREVGIKDLNIRGELNNNGDGTWAPIYGGLRLLSTSMDTENVTIDGVAYGMCRSNTVVARDVNVFAHGYFCAYIAWYTINLEVDTGYFQAFGHHTSSGPNDTEKHIPYTREYHPINAANEQFAAFEDTFIDGNGGIDDTDPELRRPRLTAIKCSISSVKFNNVAMDYWQEIGIAIGENSNVICNEMRFESVGECYIYLKGNYSQVLFNGAHSSVIDAEYDIYQGPSSSDTVTLIDSPVITCAGYGSTKATSHKLHEGNNSDLAINVVARRTENYPNSPIFHFLTGGLDTISLLPDGYEDSFYAGNRKYITPSYINDRNNKIKNIIIDADTTSSLNDNIYKEELSFEGVNRTTSVLRITSTVSIGTSYNNAPKLEFKNLTVDFRSGRIRFYSTQYGGGGSITFIKCNIITTNYQMILSENSYSNPDNVRFINCTFYSNRYDAIGCGRIIIESNEYSYTLSSPIVRYAYAEDTWSKNLSANFIQKGTTANRNTITYHLEKGHRFYNITTGRDETWNGRQWVLDNGYPYTISKGTTANIPVLPAMKIGTEYTDTSEGTKKVLTQNGSCGYGTFAFSAAFPKINRDFYIGNTKVTPVDGDFSVSMPAGTYRVSCVGYDCYPNTVTIAEGSTISIYQKASKYTNTFKVTITAKNNSNEVVTNLNIKVGGKTATIPSGKNYYEVYLTTGNYTIMADGYADQIPLKVNGLATIITAVFATEESQELVTSSGHLYDHDHICNGEGTNITAGTYSVAVDGISTNISLTSTDLNIILYFINEPIAGINKQLAYFLIRKWFAAGHYGTYINNAGARLYSDTVGTSTGNSATFTDTSTNLVCTVTHTAGTNATWELVPSGSTSDSSMNIVAASGATLTASANTYYTFAAAVNTLAVTLPAMTDVTSVKALCLAFTAGTTPQITFTSADSKTVAYYDTYNIDAECEYEVTCLYNGTKWIVSNALIG